MYNASDIGPNTQININAYNGWINWKLKSNFVTLCIIFKGSIPSTLDIYSHIWLQAINFLFETFFLYAFLAI